jgi:hypothetical protein
LGPESPTEKKEIVMKRYEAKAKREMRCGETIKQPGELICTVKYEDDVPAKCGGQSPPYTVHHGVNDAIGV